MKHRLLIAAAAWMLGPTPSYGCATIRPLDLKDVRYADLVLVGRISHYHIVRDMEFRRKMLADANLPPAIRNFYAGPEGVISDYARFTITVDRVLIGKAPRVIMATWDASTFGEPETIEHGSYLIALNGPSSRVSPVRGSGATILPKSKLATFHVLNPACSGAFIFESTTTRAKALRQILESQMEQTSPTNK